MMSYAYALHKACRLTGFRRARRVGEGREITRGINEADAGRRLVYIYFDIDFFFNKCSRLMCPHERGAVNAYGGEESTQSVRNLVGQL